MEFKYMLVLLVEIIFISKMLVNASLSIPRHESGRKANFQKSHVIKSIQSEDGDIIDCTDIYKQPAFDHPALKNHKIQMNPTNDVKMEPMATDRGSPVTITTQLWQKSGSCPKGTIPIRRILKTNVTNGHKSENYGRKKPMILHHDKKFNESKMLYLFQKNHSLAILHTEGYAYIGAKGDIKVWNPHVEKDDEYSTSQVALKSGPYYDYEAIEAGWAVNPGVYGDRKTRLFVYWTSDGSRETGCFDLTCSGFVQTSHEIALGAAIYPISTPDGLPYQITLYIHKDSYTQNWWVQYGEKTNIGYWPPDLFDWLDHHAETVQWGGEVYSSGVGMDHHPHTATEMGSGEFPDYVMGTSGSIKRLRILGNNHILKFPSWVYSYSDEYDCYGAFLLIDYVEDPEFYYGGPGRNPVCN